MKLPSWNRHTTILIVILAVATGLRFASLTSQSLWVDELHSVRESDPNITWGELVSYLLCCDLSPPLFYAVQRLLFTIFGVSEFVARVLPASCGVVSVWAMYLLGKEILSKNLGLIAAALTAVNYYNIYYSQEARNYILLFLFTVFSYLYFFKLHKTLSRKAMIGFAVFSIAALYTHYFSIFILASQAFISFLFIFVAEDRKKYLTVFGIAGAIIVLGYLPWIPYVLEMMKITSVWMPVPEASFMMDYFNEYFGNAALLYPFLILLLLYYTWNLFVTPDVSLKNLKDHPLHFSFLVLFVGILFSYFVPYLRSLLVVSMLFGRYTIVAVPGIMIALAFAIVLIKNKVVQTVVIFFVLMLSFIDIVFTKRTYVKSNPRKTEFRKVTEYIVESYPDQIPIVEEKTSWHHAWYLNLYNYKSPLFGGKKEVTVESIINRAKPEHDINSFWLIGAHGFEPHLDPGIAQKLDSAFTLVTQKEFYDTWAQLYIRKDTSGGSVKKYVPVAMNYFTPPTEIEGDVVIPIWEGSVSSSPISMVNGKYFLNILQHGTRANGQYAHINIYLNERKVGDFTSTESLTNQKIPIEIESDTQVVIRLEMDNDLMKDVEDRNCFVKMITIADRGEKPR